MEYFLETYGLSTLIFVNLSNLIAFCKADLFPSGVNGTFMEVLCYRLFYLSLCTIQTRIFLLGRQYLYVRLLPFPLSLRLMTNKRLIVQTWRKRFTACT